MDSRLAFIRACVVCCLMSGWDDVHWVKTSADIPRNDFLNFTPQELVKKYPKISLDDVLMQRHIFFPRKYPMPPTVDKGTLKYRQNLILKSPADLKDSIFSELSLELIRSGFPQFSAEDLLRERAVRDVRRIMGRIRTSIGRRALGTKEAVISDLNKAKSALANAKPLSAEMEAASQWLNQVGENVARW
jgi:hypothetical protein